MKSEKGRVEDTERGGASKRQSCCTAACLLLIQADIAYFADPKLFTVSFPCTPISASRHGRTPS
eukprot:scaffold407_cov251-Pinguiococcus_pyrenoidosus.AAC.29